MGDMAKGKVSTAVVFRGDKDKTVTGLKRTDLTTSERR